MGFSWRQNLCGKRGEGQAETGFWRSGGVGGGGSGAVKGQKCLQNDLFGLKMARNGAGNGNPDTLGRSGREKREKWGENGRKRGANYEFSEWHEWGAENGVKLRNAPKTRKWGWKTGEKCILGRFWAARGLRRAETAKNGCHPEPVEGSGPQRWRWPSRRPRCLDCARHDRIGCRAGRGGIGADKIQSVSIRVHPWLDS